MNVEQIKEWIAGDEYAAVELAWMEAVENEMDLPGDQVAQVLEALVAAHQDNQAETLGWALLADRAERQDARAILDLVRSAASAVPFSAELRSQAAELYRRAYPQVEHFDAMLAASGLSGSQSPRRAFRTLDICLPILPGTYLVNRFDNRIVRIRTLDPVSRMFLAEDPAGEEISLEPQALADEFQLIDERDFRVLSRRPEELARLFQDDPAAVLIGACLAVGGQVDSTGLKDKLVPQFLSSEAWGGWWNRARTAAKRCPQLTLEGRNPILVTYHPGGKTLEEEFAGAIDAARTPTEHLAVLRDYVREAKVRHQPPLPAVTDKILHSLAEQARSFLHRRPSDALAAALAVQSAGELGVQAPPVECPSPAEVLAAAPHRSQVVAQLEDKSLWDAALDALVTQADAAEHLEALLALSSADQLDAVASRLQAAGHVQAISAAISRTLADPLANLELCLWLWNGPAEPIDDLPPKLEILSRLFKVLQDLAHEWQIPQGRRKATQRQVRSALAARDYASFRQAASEMTEAVAGITKGRIERAEGLAETVRDELLGILRERFFRLFAKTRVLPWQDEATIWTTAQALRRREAELKELVEVKILANARAIGEAADHGDLSENSEWKYALEQRDILRAQAAKMQDEIARARVIRPEDVATDTVGIGSKVVVRRLDTQQEVEMTFLGPWDTNLETRVYSYLTATGLSLMGKPPGETVVLKLDGTDAEYRIEKVDSAIPPHPPKQAPPP